MYFAYGWPRSFRVFDDREALSSNHNTSSSGSSSSAHSNHSQSNHLAHGEAIVYLRCTGGAPFLGGASVASVDNSRLTSAGSSATSLNKAKATAPTSNKAAGAAHTRPFVVLVTTTTVQLWSGHEHRVRVGEHVRDRACVARAGVNFRAHWNEARGVLVVLTGGNKLHLYQVRSQTQKHNNLGGSDDVAAVADPACSKVDVLLFHTLDLDEEVSSPRSAVSAAAAAAAAAATPGSAETGGVHVGDMSSPPLSPARDTDATAATFFSSSVPPSPMPVSGSGGDDDNNNNNSAGTSYPATRDATGPIQCTALASDRAYLYVACADGGVVAYAWRHVVHGGHGERRVRWDPMGLSARGPAVRQLDVGLGNRAPDQPRCESQSLAAAVLADGRCALLRYSTGVTAERGTRLSLLCWLPLGEGDVGAKAVVAALSPNGHLLAVGGGGGETALFDVAPLLGSTGAGEDATSPPPRPRVTCVLTLADWGHAPSDCGPVSCLRWSPLGDAVAVGWRGRGLALWSTSGCRLLCTVRQASLLTSVTAGGAPHPRTSSGGDVGESAISPPRSPKSSGMDGRRRTSQTKVAFVPPSEPLEMGCAAICWGMHGYYVLAASHWHGAMRASGVQCFLQFSLARSVWDRKHVDAGSGIKHLLLGADRLLLVDANRSGSGDTANDQPFVRHACVPTAYRASAWPMRLCASSPDGTDVAVAGTVGLALYSRRGAAGVAAGGGGWTVGAGGGAASGGSWRVFGDVSQERSLTAHMLAWMPRVVCAVAHSPAPLRPPRGGKAIPSLMPSSRGGFGTSSSQGNGAGWSLVFYPRYHLDHASLLAVVGMPEGCPAALDTAHGHLLVAHHSGEVSLLTCRVVGRLTPLGTPKVEVRVVLEVAPCLLGMSMPSPARAIRSVALLKTSDRSSMPNAALVLRQDGALSILQLGSGRELELGRGVEMFWITEQFSISPTRAGADAAAPVTPRPPEMPSFGHPIWAYGRLGVQVWYPDMLDKMLETVESLVCAMAPAPVVGELRSTSSSSDEVHEVDSAVADEVSPALPHPPATAAAAAAVITTDAAEDEAALRESELEFDREVYPLGPAPVPGCLVGISQRVVSSAVGGALAGGGGGGGSGGGGGGSNSNADADDDEQSNSPRHGITMASTPIETALHDPHVRAQPLLPCLLRHLVRRGALEEAARLAWMGRHAEHFTHSLEWLLFTALSGASASRGVVPAKSPGHGLDPAEVLTAAADLVLSFPVASEVVVAVARKIDEKEWVRLFSAIGSPLTMFERCLFTHRLRTAAGYLIVIEKLQGASAWRVATLRLLEHASLQGNDDDMNLARELSHFLDRTAACSSGDDAVDEEGTLAQGNRTSREKDGWLLRALGLGGGNGGGGGGGGGGFTPSSRVPTSPAPLGAGEQPLPAEPSLARLATNDGVHPDELASGVRAFLAKLLK